MADRSEARRTKLAPTQELAFRKWYRGWAEVADLDADPDHPLQKYDYRGAFLAGEAPTIDESDGEYHWSSQFKDPDHPNRFVGGVDTTKTTNGEPQAADDATLLSIALHGDPSDWALLSDEELDRAVALGEEDRRLTEAAKSYQAEKMLEGRAKGTPLAHGVEPELVFPGFGPERLADPAVLDEFFEPGRAPGLEEMLHGRTPRGYPLTEQGIRAERRDEGRSVDELFGGPAPAAPDPQVAAELAGAAAEQDQTDLNTFLSPWRVLGEAALPVRLKHQLDPELEMGPSAKAISELTVAQLRGDDPIGKWINSYLEIAGIRASIEEQGYIPTLPGMPGILLPGVPGIALSSLAQRKEGVVEAGERERVGHFMGNVRSTLSWAARAARVITPSIDRASPIGLGLSEEADVVVDVGRAILSGMGESIVEFNEDPAGQMERSPEEAIENLFAAAAPLTIVARASMRGVSATRTVMAYLAGGAEGLASIDATIPLSDAVRQAIRASVDMQGVKDGAHVTATLTEIADDLASHIDSGAVDAVRLEAAAAFAERRAVRKSTDPEALAAGAALQSRVKLAEGEIVGRRVELAEAIPPPSERVATEVLGALDENPDAVLAAKRGLDAGERASLDAEEFLQSLPSSEGTRDLIERTKALRARMRAVQAGIDEQAGALEDSLQVRDTWQPGARVRVGRQVRWIIEERTKRGKRQVLVSRTKTGRGRGADLEWVPAGSIKIHEITPRKPGMIELTPENATPSMVRAYIKQRGGIHYEDPDYKAFPGLFTKDRRRSLDHWAEELGQGGGPFKDRDTAHDWLEERLLDEDTAGEAAGGAEQLARHQEEVAAATTPRGAVVSPEELPATAESGAENLKRFGVKGGERKVREALKKPYEQLEVQVGDVILTDPSGVGFDPASPHVYRVIEDPDTGSLMLEDGRKLRLSDMQALEGIQGVRLGRVGKKTKTAPVAAADDLVVEAPRGTTAAEDMLETVEAQSLRMVEQRARAQALAELVADSPNKTLPDRVRELARQALKGKPKAVILWASLAGAALAANEDSEAQLAAMGPLVVLAAVPRLRTAGRRARALRTASNQLGGIGAGMIDRAPKAGSRQAFKDAIRREGKITREVALLEELDPKGLDKLYEASHRALDASVNEAVNLSPAVDDFMSAVSRGVDQGPLRGAAYRELEVLAGTENARLFFDMADAIAVERPLHENLTDVLSVMGQVRRNGGVERLRKLTGGDVGQLGQLGVYRQIHTGLRPALAHRGSARHASPAELAENRQRVADVLAGKPVAPRPSRPTAPPLDPAAAYNAERGAARVDTIATLSVSALGASIGAYLGSQVENEEGSGDFTPTGLLVGGAVAFGISRYFTHPAVRRAFVDAASIRNERARKLLGVREPTDDPNFERALMAILEPLIPETIGPGVVRAAGPAGAVAGGLAGAALVGYPDEDKPSLIAAGIAAATGALLGRKAARTVVSAVFDKPMDARRAFRRFMTEDKGLPPEFSAERRAFRARMDGRTKELEDVSRVLERHGTKVGADVDDYLRGNRALSSLPKSVRRAAHNMRLLLDEMALDLIQVGIATGHVADIIRTNVGSYVPRLYWAFEADDANRIMEQAISWAQANNIPIPLLSDINYLKKRKDLPKAVREALGEITDAPWILLRKRGKMVSADIEVHRFQNWIASSEYTAPTGVIPRQVGEREIFIWAKANGARPPASPDEVRAIARKIREAELGGHSEAVPSGTDGSGRRVVEWGGRRFIGMPDSPKWGSLAGRYVDEDIALDQIAMRAGPESLIQAIEAAGLALFKTAKVLWNPASLGRNMMWNTIAADLAGVSPANLAAYGRTFSEFKNEGDFYIEARRVGLFGGEFRKAEIAELWGGVRDFKKAAAAAAGFEASAFTTATRAWTRVATSKIGRGADAVTGSLERFHEGSEQFSKLLVYMHARNKLAMSAEDAAIYAKRWIYDYRDVPEVIKFTRKSVFGVPFITFSYKAIPRVLETALAVGDPKKAWRFWKYPAMFGAVNEYSALVLGDVSEGPPAGGVSPEAAVRELVSTPIRTMKDIVASGLGFSGGRAGDWKRHLPDYAGPNQVLLPKVDSFGRARAVDLTWMLGWGDLGEFGTGPLGRNLARAGLAYPRFLEPGNPWAHAFTASLTGRDPFTGKEVLSPLASTGETVMDYTSYLLRLWGPTLLNPAGLSFEKMRRSLGGEFGVDPFVPDPLTAVLSEVAGIRQRPFDPNSSFEFKVRERNRLINKARGELFILRRTPGVPEATIERKIGQVRALMAAFEQDYGTQAPPENAILEQVLLERSSAAIEQGDAAVEQLLGGGGAGE